MTATSPKPDRSQEHRVKVLKKTVEHIQDKIFALQAQIAHEHGYIGADETNKFFAESGVPLD